MPSLVIYTILPETHSATRPSGALFHANRQHAENGQFQVRYSDRDSDSGQSVREVSERFEAAAEVGSVREVIG